MPLKPELIAGLLHRAADEPLGICVETNNVPAVEKELSAFRQDLDQPKWKDLMLCRTETEGQLFIIHKSVELDP